MYGSRQQVMVIEGSYGWWRTKEENELEYVVGLMEKLSLEGNKVCMPTTIGEDEGWICIREPNG